MYIYVYTYTYTIDYKTYSVNIIICKYTRANVYVHLNMANGVTRGD